MTKLKSTITARELLEMVAGDRCPCGHAKGTHRPPRKRLNGETMGTCRAKDCDCKGVVDLTDEHVLYGLR